jgi:hypothetical protein
VLKRGTVTIIVTEEEIVNRQSIEDNPSIDGWRRVPAQKSQAEGVKRNADDE